MNKVRRFGALAAAFLAVSTMTSLAATPASAASPLLAASGTSAAAGASAASSAAASDAPAASPAAAARRAAGSATATAPAKSAAAEPKVKGPEPINQLIAVRDGQTSLVKVWWKTDRTICDAKLIIWGNSRVTVAYPPMFRNFTSFSDGPTLTRRESDFTSFRVTPHVGGSAWVILAGTMTYDYCGRHARTQSKSTGFLLTVQA
jgi:hypothetical protein